MKAIPRVLCAVLILASSTPAPSRADSGVIVHTAKPYGAVVAGIEALGGTVTYQYQNVDGLAARIPDARLGELQAMGEVSGVEEDDLVEVSPPRGEVFQAASFDLGDRELLGAAELAAAGLEPASYYSYLSGVTGAVDTWGATGAGEGSIVAVIDSGTHTDHLCLAGRVIEGPDFSTDAGTPFEGSTVATNGPHGTLVAGQVNAICAILIFPGDPFEVHLPPEAKIPYDPVPGSFLVPLYGIAPLAQIYAVKVFPHTGGGIPTSTLLAAIDHVVTARRTGVLDVDVINMSIGGGSLNDGRSLHERLVDAATDAGITVAISAGNSGPSPNTVGRAATAYSSLAVGAASDPVHTRVLWDLILGPGAGTTLYPTDELRIADFSSRGPYADGRRGPDLVATGVFNLGPVTVDSIQTLEIGSGTSFAAPQVAGAAALLHAWAEQNDPSINARHIRNALIDGAVPLAAEWSVQSQGAGYLNVRNSLDLLASGHVNAGLPHASSGGKLKPNVHFDPDGSFSTSVTIERGRSVSWVLDVDESTEEVIVEIDPAGGTIPPGPSGALGIPESFELYVKSAKRGGFAPDFVDHANVFDHAVAEILPGSVVLSGGIAGNLAGAPPAVLEPGLMKVTLGSAWTNNTRFLDADVTITRLEGAAGQSAGGATLTIGDDETQVFAVDVPAGTAKATFDLSWQHDWSKFPTNNMSLLFVSPSSYPSLAPFFDGATLSSPERQVIDQPEAGTWLVLVRAYEVQHGRDPYVLQVTME